MILQHAYATYHKCPFCHVAPFTGNYSCYICPNSLHQNPMNSFCMDFSISNIGPFPDISVTLGVITSRPSRCSICQIRALTITPSWPFPGRGGQFETGGPGPRPIIWSRPGYRQWQRRLAGQNGSEEYRQIRPSVHQYVYQWGSECHGRTICGEELLPSNVLGLG